MERRLKDTAHGKVVIAVDEDDDYSAVVTLQSTGEAIGEFHFRLIQSEWPTPDFLKLTGMHIEGHEGKFKQQGIGEEILRLVIDVSGYRIVAEDHDGLRNDEGSYLTEEGPIFVARMREKGLISPSRTLPDDYDDE